MKRIIKWLTSWFSQSEETTAADQFNKSLPDNPRSAPMPDIYAEEHADTVPNLQILGATNADVDGEAGYNPYDTGVLQKNQGSKPRSN